MKILVLSMRIPFPCNSGAKITLYNYLKTIDKLGRKFDLVCFDDELQGDYEKSMEELRKSFINIQRIEIIKVTKIQRFMGAIISFMKTQPLQVGYFSNIATKLKFNNRFDVNEYDKIFIHTIRLANIISKRYLEKSIVFFADSIARNYEKSSEYVGFLKSLLFSIEAPLTKKYEKDLDGKISKGIFHSTTDMEYLKTKNSIAIPILKPRNEKFVPISSETQRRFILIGQYSYFPNVRAIEYLINNSEKIESSNIKIDIIGGSLSQKYIDLISDMKNINYLGFVDDFNKEMIDSYGVLCPIEIGAGMQNKILDAFVTGRPAISTEFSAYPYEEYLKLKYNIDISNDIVKYQDKDSFLEELTRILNDRALANDYARKSYEISKFFDLNLLENELKEIL